MRLPLAVAVLMGLGMLASSSGSAQSLGDVAREQKQNSTQQKTSAPKKVITEDDLPTQETISTGSSAENTNDATSKDEKQGDSAADKMKSADQFKAAIRAQRHNVDALQKQLDDLKGSIHFVEANAYSNGVQYNEHQIKKQKEAERLQKQLDGQKSKLQDMQEQARKAGFGSAVYE